MKEVLLIFPTQLFKNHPGLKKGRGILLVEEPRYFTDFKFHKQKLIFHRASMKAYYDFLKKKGYQVQYIDYNKSWKPLTKGVTLISIDPLDHKLRKKLPKSTTLLESPGFFGGTLKKSKRYLMANFYKQQRLRLKILVHNGKPSGGKWSFDAENRKALPKDNKPPKISARTNKYIKEATTYVNKHFPKNPGNTKAFIYPTTFTEANKWLTSFLKTRLKKFGDYQDAIVKEESFLYHSLLSALLNVGLLTPKEVIDKVLETRAPLNAIEGFVRQVIGWREFILQVYLMEGEHQRKSNIFHHNKPLPKSFYTASTGIEPIDNVIQKTLDHAYAHHIERLMVLGNYMLLKGYAPNQIYRWFMEMYIDAYDWVMVPNVYGMSQFADGGLMSTKPYISSSNYILNMSNFKKGDWCKIWDDLFWSFIKRNKKLLSKNPRMALLVKQAAKRKG